MPLSCICLEKPRTRWPGAGSLLDLYLTCWQLVSYKINWVQTQPEGTNPCILFWIQPFFKLLISWITRLGSSITLPGTLFSSNCTFYISLAKFASFHFVKFQNWDKWLMCPFNMKMNLASKFSLSSFSPYLLEGMTDIACPLTLNSSSPGTLPFQRGSPTPLPT